MKSITITLPDVAGQRKGVGFLSPLYSTANQLVPGHVMSISLVFDLCQFTTRISRELILTFGESRYYMYCMPSIFINIIPGACELMS